MQKKRFKSPEIKDKFLIEKAHGVSAPFRLLGVERCMA